MHGDTLKKLTLFREFLIKIQMEILPANIKKEKKEG